MSSFTGEIEVRMTKRRTNGRIVWELLTPIVYGVGSELSADRILIPAGAETDGLSAPWWAAWHPWFHVLDEKTFRPAVLHDRLLQIRDRSRRAIDAAFHEALRVMKVHPLRAWLMHQAVRAQARRTGDR